MILLAIDPGFDRLGYAIFSKAQKKDFKYVSSGLIKTNSSADIENRLKQIYEDVKEIIQLHKPDLLIIEQLFFFKNQKTAIKVSQAQGVILLLAGLNNIGVHFLTPLQIKQIITGYGHADKKAVKKMVSLTINTDKKNDDEIDAIACGLAYCYQNKNLLQ